MPGGRPTKLDQVVRHRDNGQPVTAGEQVIERVQLGMDLADAADSAGIDRSTLHRWVVAGARHRAQQAQGRLKTPTAQQLALIEFCNSYERATAEAEASRLGIIQRAAVGGAVVTKRTVKRGAPDAANPDGLVLEVTEVTETLRPEWTAAAWWLERKRGYVKRYEVTGAEGAPLVPQAEAARDLADSLRDWLSDDGAKAEAAATVRRSRAKPKAKPPAS